MAAARSAPSETRAPSQRLRRPIPRPTSGRACASSARLGISLREIARRIGVSASLVSQIERDKVNPSVSTLWALARELGLNMGDLFDEEIRPPPSTSPAARCSVAVSPPDQRSVINLASGVIWERLTPERDPASSSCA